MDLEGEKIELGKRIVSPIEDIKFSDLKVGDFFELVGMSGYPLIEMNITSITEVSGKQIIEGTSNSDENKKIRIQYDPELSEYTQV